MTAKSFNYARIDYKSQAPALLDEPTSSIDKAHDLSYADLFSEYNRNGTTIVLATHDCELEKFDNTII